MPPFEQTDRIATLTARAEAAERERDELRKQMSMTLGVGDGSGSLFVHGDWDSINTVRARLREAGEAIARAEAAERERDELSGKLRAAEFALRNRESMASRYMGNKARAEAAEAKLAKAVEALSRISSRARWARGIAAEEVSEIASATLAEITDTGEM